MRKPSRLTLFSALALILCGAIVVMVARGAASQALVTVVIQADAPGPKIDRHIFGQFAEHLGRGIYGGIWVGRILPSPTPGAIATTCSRR